MPRKKSYGVVTADTIRSHRQDEVSQAAMAARLGVPSKVVQQHEKRGGPLVYCLLSKVASLPAVSDSWPVGCLMSLPAKWDRDEVDALVRDMKWTPMDFSVSMGYALKTGYDWLALHPRRHPPLLVVRLVQVLVHLRAHDPVTYEHALATMGWTRGPIAQEISQ